MNGSYGYKQPSHISQGVLQQYAATRLKDNALFYEMFNGKSRGLRASLLENKQIVVFCVLC